MLDTIQLTTSISEPLYHQIIRTYLDTESVKDTAAICNVSTVKVRKVLITKGMWSSRTSVEIQHYLSIGKTTAEIAHILCTTEKAVQQYLPYSRGLYGGDNPSVSAVNSALYRERIRIAQAKTLKKKRSLAEENHWPEILEAINNQEELMMPKKPNHPEENDYLRLHLEMLDNDGNPADAETTRTLRECGESSLRQYNLTRYFSVQRDALVGAALCDSAVLRLAEQPFAQFCSPGETICGADRQANQTICDAYRVGLLLSLDERRRRVLGR